MTSSKAGRIVAIGCFILPLACSTQSATKTATSITESFVFLPSTGSDVDILFLIDNSTSMAVAQEKLYAQIPTFLTQLSPPNLPTMPNLHIGVVSSDLGAPGDSTASEGCTTMGDEGVLQATPRTIPSAQPPVTCSNTTIAPGAGYISDVPGSLNFTDPVATVLQCILPLGSTGCGFDQQLAAIDRALGADGSPAPNANGGFLRPEAALAIIILSDDDDCSTPADTRLYSLNGGAQSLTNPLGPVSHYRCNQWGHLCQDPAAGNAVIMPPLDPPADVMMTGTTPTLDLQDCISNDSGSGMLTPVSQFVSDIKALKTDPDNQIFVGAITAPSSPYTVSWTPQTMGPAQGELWPQVEHSCGGRGEDDVNPEATQNTTDGSFGDPAVRIAQFVSAFPGSVLASICDPSYAALATALASKIAAISAAAIPCVTGQVQLDVQGVPVCSVTENHLGTGNTIVSQAIPNCNANGSVAPCWTLGPGACADGQALQVNQDATTSGASDLSFSVSCQICDGAGGTPGC